MIETNGELTYGQQWHRQGRGTDGPCPLQNVYEFNLIVFPVTTTSVERSFSILKWLKIYLRYKTGEERLTTLALMTVHKETSVDKEKVVSVFSKCKKNKTFLKIKSKGNPGNRKHFYGVPYTIILLFNSYTEI